MKPKDFYLERHEILRFWEKADKRGECWVFLGKLGHGGYGSVYLCRDGKWVGVKAHRVAYQATYGDLTKDYIVCHHCDNPRCVRPEHLFKGTPKDNTQDMIAKGRSKLAPPNPERHWKRKLSDEDIRWARARPKSEPLKVIEEKLCIEKRYASKIKLGKTHLWLK